MMINKGVPDGAEDCIDVWIPFVFCPQQENILCFTLKYSQFVCELNTEIDMLASVTSCEYEQMRIFSAMFYN